MTWGVCDHYDYCCILRYHIFIFIFMSQFGWLTRECWTFAMAKRLDYYLNFLDLCASFVPFRFLINKYITNFFFFLNRMSLKEQNATLKWISQFLFLFGKWFEEWSDFSVQTKILHSIHSLFFLVMIRCFFLL